MKNKIIVAIAMGIIVTGISISFLLNNPSKKVLINSQNVRSSYDKMLSMNFETTAGSGEYTTSTDNNWPTEGYTFNAELSKCENGSEITWDDVNKKILVKANKSDKCYVYFDKAISIKGVDYTGTYDGMQHSISLEVGTSEYTAYYSTDKELNKTNFKEGSTVAPTIVNASTMTVYWCVDAAVGNVNCGNNSITINKATSYLEVSPSSITVVYYDISLPETKTINFHLTYYGNGTVYCKDTKIGTGDINKDVELSFYLTNEVASKGTDTITCYSIEDDNYLSASKKIDIVYYNR